MCGFTKSSMSLSEESSVDRGSNVAGGAFLFTRITVATMTPTKQSRRIIATTIDMALSVGVLEVMLLVVKLLMDVVVVLMVLSSGVLEVVLLVVKLLRVVVVVLVVVGVFMADVVAVVVVAFVNIMAVVVAVAVVTVVVVRLHSGSS